MRVLHTDESLAPLDRLLASIDPAARRRFLDEVAGALLAAPPMQRERLFATLDALRIHRGYVQGAAHALGVDPRTVRNRVAQIRALTGMRADSDELRMASLLLALAD